uniref:Secreted protein n=1 Tax=Macrostomum lignano TaxID=282301 RepID=A0A1I8G9L3_9PLAT
MIESSRAILLLLWLLTVAIPQCRSAPSSLRPTRTSRSTGSVDPACKLRSLWLRLISGSSPTRKLCARSCAAFCTESSTAAGI